VLLYAPDATTMTGWIWKSVVAGSAGTVVHFLFMHFKSWTGLLPSFQPYLSFQIALSHWIGSNVPAIVPWALSFLNGMTILGSCLLALIGCYRVKPGR
jgi:hypothetical protein